MARKPAWNQCLGAFILVGGLACWASADDPPRTLENLLRELAVAQPSAASADGMRDAAELRGQLDDLITERNQVVQRNAGFFQLLLETRDKEVSHAQAIVALGNATRFLAAAQANYAQQMNLAAQAGKEPLGFANARAFVERATADKQAAEATCRRAFQELGQHITTCQQQAGDFFGVYSSLRSLLPHRRDAANTVIADVVAQRRRHSPDFIDGDVIEAIALAYDGRVSEATARLDEANTILDRYPPLLGTILAEDCCAAWLLLGRLDKVGPFIAAIDKTHVKQRTAAQQWLSAAFSMLRGQHAEALKKYNLAIAKAGARPPSALRAEAALAALDGLKGSEAVKKAREHLERVEADRHWSVLRARAALAAAEKEWDAALALVEEAKSLAPSCLEEVLETQCVAYRNKEPRPSRAGQ